MLGKGGVVIALPLLCLRELVPTFVGAQVDRDIAVRRVAGSNRWRPQAAAKLRPAVRMLCQLPRHERREAIATLQMVDAKVSSLLETRKKRRDVRDVAVASVLRF
jgi:hypothetical protein